MFLRHFYSCVMGLILVVSFSPAAAQTLNGSFIEKHFDQSYGLNDLRCRSMYKDPKGFLWIATDVGVSRFDGSSFRNYTNADGLEGDKVRLFLPDNTGKLYALANNCVYLVCPGQAKTFRKVYTTDTSIVMFIPLDSARFYISYQDVPGLYKVDHGRSKKIPGLDQRIAYISAREGYRQMNVLTTEGDIGVFEDDAFAGKVMPPASQGTFDDLAEDLKGNTWAIAGHYLYKIGPGGIADSLALPVQEVNGGYTIAFTGDRSFWVLMGWRLFYNNEGVLTETDYHISDDKINTQSSSMFVDQDKSIWFVNPFGLFNLRKTPFYTASPDYYSSSSGGKLLLNFDPGFDQANKRELQAFEMSLKTIPSIGRYKDRSGKLWVTTVNGAYTLDNMLKLESFPSDTAGGISRRSFMIYMLEDGKGSFWGVGLSSMNRLIDRHFTYTHWPNLFKGIGLDQNDRMWVFDDDGIYVSGDTGFNKLSIPAGLNSKDFGVLKNNFEGDIWINKGSVLYHIIQQKNAVGIIDSFQVMNSNASEVINEFEFDKAGNLWVFYGNKMIIYTVDHKGHLNNTRYLCLGADDGLLAIAGNGTRLISTGDGNMSFAQSVVFNANDILAGASKPAPAPYFQGLNLFNKQYNWAAQGYETFENGLPVDLRLRYDQNFLSFQFGSIGFSNTNLYQYQYKLEGLNTDWQTAGTERKASYNSLPPGHYNFLLRVANENGRWSKPISYAFVIMPPWYLTWWAITFWIVLFAGAISTFFFLRIASVKRKAQAEQMATEQRLVALRAQINPHFIQNIFGFLSHTISMDSADKALQEIRKVSTYLRNVLQGSDKAAVTLEEELEFITDYLDMQQELLNHRFSYEINADEDIDTFGMKVPSMLLQPVVENAIKYGTDDPGNKISINFSQDDAYIICTVTDRNPVSTIEKPKGYKSWGLSFTEEKMVLFYKKCKNKPEIHFAPKAEGQGHAVTIKLPVK